MLQTPASLSMQNASIQKAVFVCELNLQPFLTQKRLLRTEGTRTEQAAGRKACRTRPDVLKNPSTAGSNPAQSSPAASKKSGRIMAAPL